MAYYHDFCYSLQTAPLVSNPWKGDRKTIAIKVLSITMMALGGDGGRETADSAVILSSLYG